MLFLLLTGVLLIILAILFYQSDCDLVLLFYCKLFSNCTDSLRGKVVWITGASSGIGEELAYQLARKGTKLILSARREKELEKVLKKCQELSLTDNKNSHMIVPLDLSQYDTHSKCVNTVIENYGIVDYLVNNAGRSQTGVAMDTSIEVCRYLLEVNTLGTINLTNCVLPHMTNKKDGSIVIISSIAGKLGSPCSAAYSASKHALQGYFDALRIEVYSSNINILSVCPGPIDVGARSTIGTTLDKKDQVTPLERVDTRMTVGRCCQLITVAMATKLDEVWITRQPVLLFTYVNQYIPLLAKWLGKSVGQKRMAKILAHLKKN